MSLIADIRAGLENNLNTLPALKASGYEKAAPVAPTVEVLARYEIDYDLANDADQLTFYVRLIVRDTGDGRAASTMFDQYAERTGEYSVKAALESDRTLGGVVDEVRVTGLADVQPMTVPSTPQVNVFGGTWTVEVIASY